MHRVLPPKFLCYYLLLVDEREVTELHETLYLLPERLLTLPHHNHACCRYVNRRREKENASRSSLQSVHSSFLKRMRHTKDSG
jgi:hypothetical protein